MNTLPIILESTLPELKHLGFRRYMAHPVLQPWVQCYWVAQQDSLPEQGFTETLYPDGGTSLTFTFNQNQHPHLEFKATQNAMKVSFQHTVDAIGIRFNPVGAFALFGVDMNDLFNHDDASAEFEKTFADLKDQLAQYTLTHSRLSLIESWLLTQLEQHNSSPGLLQHFIPRYLISDSNIDEFVKHESISRRQLERKFQQEIGLSPAQLKQLHRVKKARYFISLNPLNSLTDVALDCGFYDQAHFIRNFQKVTGQTPGQYKTRKMSQKYNP
ncbi:MAG: AraC family transcriptional regulator [Gammaproteobacteria bacterium]|nr:MAG: AraC family transcriptional regulator [Gammaproteobacteria bacterium]